MKKPLILALLALSVSVAKATIATKLDSNIQPYSISNPIQSQGTILELTETGGKLVDQFTGEVKEFFHPKANVTFVIGDIVSYVVITLPNGGTIVNSIRQGHYAVSNFN